MERRDLERCSVAAQGQRDRLAKLTMVLWGHGCKLSQSIIQVLFIGQT